MVFTTNKLIIIFIIAIGIDVSFLVHSYSLDPKFNEQEGQRPRDGIAFGHNDIMNVTDISLYIVNTRETDSIEIRYGVVFLDPSKVGKIGIYFPYNMTMITNSSAWDYDSVDSGTVFMKKYSCTDKKYCVQNFHEQIIFELVPEHTKFDFQNRYQHSLKIKFNDYAHDADIFFREHNLKNDPLEFRYYDDTKKKITIIIPEQSGNIHSIPIPNANLFHNSGNDYGNAQLEWDLTQTSGAFFVDYEIPEERERFEDSQLGLTITGIVLGVLVGGFGTAYAKLERNTRN